MSKFWGNCVRSGKGKANSTWWLLGKVFVRKDLCVLGNEREGIWESGGSVVNGQSFLGCGDDCSYRFRNLCPFLLWVTTRKLDFSNKSFLCTENSCWNQSFLQGALVFLTREQHSETSIWEWSVLVATGVSAWGRQSWWAKRGILLTHVCSCFYTLLFTCITDVMPWVLWSLFYNSEIKSMGYCFFPHTHEYSNSPDTNWVSYNWIKFWHQLPGVFASPTG